MVLSGSTNMASGLGMRCAGLGLVGRNASRSAIPRTHAKLAPAFTGHSSHARLFSSLLQHSRSSAVLINLSPSNGVGRNARNFWGSSKTPAPVETESEKVLEEQATATSTLAEELPQTTPAVDAVVANDAPTDASLTDSISDALLSSTSNIVPALQYGDLAAIGLASWSPAGIIRWSLELINVTFSMPWLPTIIVGSLFWKLVCVPFAVKGLQSAARLQPYQAELQAMQAHMNVIRASGNTMEIQKAALRMRDFYKEKNISPLGGLVALVQMPIQLGMFFALQTLCKHPLPQLQSNVGVPEFLGQWGQTVLGDLTTGDPTYVLPAVMVALINVQIMINVKDMNTVERPGMAHVMNFIRIVSFGAVPWFFSTFPTGLTVSLLTTSAASIVQAAVMRIPAVRTKLGIPIVPKEAQGVLPSIRETIMYPFRQNLSAKEEVVAARKRAALEQLRNKQRGL